jgi:hypothetical protein
MYEDCFKWGISIATKEVLLEFKINGDVFQQNFRVRPQPIQLLLGEDFLQKYQIIIDLHEECFRKGGKDERREYGFSCPMGENVGENETNRGQTDHTTDDAPLPGIHSTQPSPRSQPDSHAEPTPLPSRQKPDLEKRPYKVIELGTTKMLATVDTGSTMSIISEEAYKSITERGYTGLQLPAEPLIIKSITSEKIAKTKILLEFKIDGDVFETPFWVTPQLRVPVTLGEDFLREKRIVIDFHQQCFRIGQKENNRIYKFFSTTEV